MSLYRTKPLTKQAVQWFPGFDHPAIVIGAHDSDEYPGLMTLNGFVPIRPGDYIVTGLKGEHYPCDPVVFDATYELVSDDPEIIDVDFEPVEQSTPVTTET